MKKLLFALLFLVFTLPAYGQFTSANPIRFGSSLPATCTPSSTRVLFYKFGANNGLYYCSATDTWSRYSALSGSSRTDYIPYFSGEGTQAPTALKYTTSASTFNTWKGSDSGIVSSWISNDRVIRFGNNDAFQTTYTSVVNAYSGFGGSACLSTNCNNRSVYFDAYVDNTSQVITFHANGTAGFISSRADEFEWGSDYVPVDSSWLMSLVPKSATGRFRVGDYTSTPTNYIDLDQATNTLTFATTSGTFVSGKFYLSTTQTPASASDTCTTGQIVWDSSYIYVCTATNTWKRSAIATW